MGLLFCFMIFVGMLVVVLREEGLFWEVSSFYFVCFLFFRFVVLFWVYLLVKKFFVFLFFLGLCRFLLVLRVVFLISSLSWEVGLGVEVCFVVFYII